MRLPKERGGARYDRPNPNQVGGVIVRVEPISVDRDAKKREAGSELYEFAASDFPDASDVAAASVPLNQRSISP